MGIQYPIESYLVSHQLIIIIIVAGIFFLTRYFLVKSLKNKKNLLRNQINAKIHQTRKKILTHYEKSNVLEFRKSFSESDQNNISIKEKDHIAAINSLASYESQVYLAGTLRELEQIVEKFNMEFDISKSETSLKEYMVG